MEVSAPASVRVRSAAAGPRPAAVHVTVTFSDPGPSSVADTARRRPLRTATEAAGGEALHAAAAGMTVNGSVTVTAPVPERAASARPLMRTGEPYTARTVSR